MRNTIGTILAVLVGAGACGSDSTSSPEPDGVETILGSGEFALPAANGFSEPGFHSVLAATLSLPQDLSTTIGRRIILTLTDVGRPLVLCSQQHPLSGCATVDWSDSESRPGVPPGGVFENSVSLTFASGARALFLSEDGSLSDSPDSFQPG